MSHRDESAHRVITSGATACAIFLAGAVLGGCAAKAPIADAYAPYRQNERERVQFVPHPGDYVVAWIGAQKQPTDLPETRAHLEAGEMFGFSRGDAGVIAMAGGTQLLLSNLPQGDPLLVWRRIARPDERKGLMWALRDLYFAMHPEPVDDEGFSSGSDWPSSTSDFDSSPRDKNDHKRREDCDDDRGRGGGGHGRVASSGGSGGGGRRK